MMRDIERIRSPTWIGDEEKIYKLLRFRGLATTCGELPV